ncbi:MAG TPA: bifunctional nicotinamidase/pyrazinamidase [Microvirga sp.]|nr:bifunctional nicotinamidase/pyrazinamidase [Microvirga sp.]
MIRPAAQDVLIIVDLQHDFLPGGALAVPAGDEVIGPINDVARRFRHVLLTQDWHPQGHVSFASSHAGKQPFETIELAYGTQVLWPDHCIQGSRGARITEALDVPQAELIIRKGYYGHTDSYSGFVEADRRTRTGLAGYLRERGVARVFCVGLATDFCVSWTALDAREAGFEAYVIEDACRGIDTGGSLAAAFEAWGRAGVRRVLTSEIEARAGR